MLKEIHTWLKNINDDEEYDICIEFATLSYLLGMLAYEEKLNKVFQIIWIRPLLQDLTPTLTFEGPFPSFQKNIIALKRDVSRHYTNRRKRY